jgi:hypothetical protein
MTPKTTRSSMSLLARARIESRRRSSCLPVPSPMRSRSMIGAVTLSAWSWLSGHDDVPWQPHRAQPPVQRRTTPAAREAWFEGGHANLTHATRITGAC